MKRLHLISIVCLALFFSMASCSDNETDSDKKPLSKDSSIKSILAYATHTERDKDTLDVTFSDDLTTLILTTRALPMGTNPVDLTKIHLVVGTAKGATVDVAEDQLFDMTNPTNKITVTAENGESTTYGLSAIVTPPYEVIPEYNTNITALWSKTGTELGLKFPKSCRSITIAGDYLLVLDNTIDYTADAKIKVYNKLTGAFVKDVPIYEGGWAGPRSYTWTIASDDAGHFAIGRLNSGGAGFWLDIYENIDAVPLTPFKLSGTAVPEFCGKKMQIMGDLFTGKAYIYLTSAHYFGAIRTNGQYCSFSMTNGAPNSTTPTIMAYEAQWYSAFVQKANIDTNDPTMYVTYNNESTYPNDPFDNWDKIHAANFEIYNPADGKLTINPVNFKYRILDSYVFNVKGCRYLFTLQQGYSTGTGEMCGMLYNISDKLDFNKTPESANYSKFKMYESPGYVSVNDNRYGSVAVWVDNINSDAYMYTFYPGSDTSEAKIEAIKMEVRDK